MKTIYCVCSFAALLFAVFIFGQNPLSRGSIQATHDALTRFEVEKSHTNFEPHSERWAHRNGTFGKRCFDNLHDRKELFASPFHSSQHHITGDVDSAWVRHYASGLAPSNDIAYAIAVDDSGNFYVTGTIDNLPFAIDGFTLKYDHAGNQLWGARYKGYNARDIVVDCYGNVYVAGWGYGTNTDADYVTIKYGSSGIEQWVARYNGPGNSIDEAVALAVDAAGDVCVTGKSVGSGTYFDYATIKYSSSGTEQWVERYNGTGTGNNNIDGALSLAIDDCGNIYVTGSSFGAGTDFDYATIKYNTVGIEQWVARYDGKGNRSDHATALGLDRMGNVYVTGQSQSDGTSYDYVTIKYDATGLVQWIATYNDSGSSSDEAIAIAIDVLGNVYVTGWSFVLATSYDYATVKYDSSGIEQWVRRYNGSRNSADYANALAVDSDGNAYVTGAINGIGKNTDYATIKYSSTGVVQWVRAYNGPGESFDYATALAVDGLGNIYVTGESHGAGEDLDYATIKYNTSGLEQLVVRYDGSGNSSDAATALVVDGEGNVYVSGGSYNTGASNDYATIKYSPLGTTQWIARYDGPGKSFDFATALVCDDSGNVYVTGESYNTSRDRDYGTVKYNSNGVEQWVARYNGTGNSEDAAVALAVDKSGNIYVAGTSMGSGTGHDYATIKYNSAGVEQWVRRYDGPGHLNDRVTALDIDNAGNVYVTGSTLNEVTGYDYTTIKYDPLGNEQWVSHYHHESGFSTDEASDLAVDAWGNAYVTGSSADHLTGIDYATIKYNSLGSPSWVARYSGNGKLPDSATALAVTSTGSVIVTGYGWDPISSEDFVTLRYNLDGVLQWAARYNGHGNKLDIAAKLAVDDDENVYVTGWSSPSADYPYFKYYDYATVKYDASGVLQWSARYNGPRISVDKVRAITVDGMGNVCVTGSSESSGYSVYTTIKYTQIPVAVNEQGSTAASNCRLMQNYPNPFNPVTTIRYAISNAEHVSLKICNLGGQEIATLVDETQTGGTHEVQWNAAALPSGVYLCRLQAGAFIAIRKLVLL